MQILTMNLLLLAGARKTSFEIKAGIVCDQPIGRPQQASNLLYYFWQRGCLGEVSKVTGTFCDTHALKDPAP